MPSTIQAIADLYAAEGGARCGNEPGDPVSLAYLRPLFGAPVLEPIRLHVDAKRYLCQASAFLRHRFAREAIRLRRWDDEARVPGRPLPDLADMRAVLEAAAGCHKTAMAGA